MLYSAPDWLIHQSAESVWKYGNAVPGLLRAPNDCVSEKLPIGVAERDSLGLLDRPSAPR